MLRSSPTGFGSVIQCERRINVDKPLRLRLSYSIALVCMAFVLSGCKTTSEATLITPDSPPPEGALPKSTSAPLPVINTHPRLEGERIAATAELAKAHSMDPEKVTLSDLLSAVHLEGEFSELPVLAEKLRGQLGVLTGLSRDNQLLARNMLEYTQIVMRLLATDSNSPRYSRQGQVADEQPTRSLLDNCI